jgi:hypothetical protein
LLALSAGVVFAAPVARLLGRWRDARVQRLPMAALASTVDLAWLGCVFIASAAFLAAGTYNPFIYFRF